MKRNTCTATSKTTNHGPTPCTYHRRVLRTHRAPRPSGRAWVRELRQGSVSGWVPASASAWEQAWPIEETTNVQGRERGRTGVGRNVEMRTSPKPRHQPLQDAPRQKPPPPQKKTTTQHYHHTRTGTWTSASDVGVGVVGAGVGAGDCAITGEGDTASLPVPSDSVGSESPICPARPPRSVSSPRPRAPANAFPQHFTEPPSTMAQDRWPPAERLSTATAVVAAA